MNAPMGRWDKLNERGKDMKKRNIAISILVGVCACFIGAGVSACGGKKGPLKMELSDDESYYIVAAARDKDCTEIVIPSEYKGKPVKEIGERAFNYCSSLTSIAIPDSVTSIGGYAFYRCYSLTNIDIPDSVTSIGDYAFFDCGGLTSIEIPDSVMVIGDYAFAYCENLASVVIGDGVTSIGKIAFYNCTSLTSVVIGDGVTSIGKIAFGDCSSLTSITFEDTSTWYRTESSSDWQNKTGGTETDVTNPSTNATNFRGKYAYYYHYWYKL